METIRKFRQKLLGGQVCLGCGITFSDPTVTEALCDSVDFFWIDMEHTPLSLESLQGHLLAARAGGAAALVRLRGNDAAFIKPALDTGADGLIAPQVRSADEVRRVVAHCRYPPDGCRGYGPRRLSNYGRQGGAEFMNEANRDVFVCAQIETVEAVNMIEEILAIRGLDSLALGPWDLAASMGRAGQVDHPEVVAVMDRIMARTRAVGLFLGVGMGCDQDYACRLAGKGVQWIQIGCDFHHLVRSVDQLVTGTRTLLGTKVKISKQHY